MQDVARRIISVADMGGTAFPVHRDRKTAFGHIADLIVFFMPVRRPDPPLLKTKFHQHQRRPVNQHPPGCFVTGWNYRSFGIFTNQEKPSPYDFFSTNRRTVSGISSTLHKS